ncbi:type II secretion system protein [Alteromonas sp. ASW11-36]|uniref:Type II secretion system protein n=1 Tax=Alteromonas arenosi TaxID=3055817 RepID=A0ABT7SSG4_9ALTE|nr:type II secretion system protein [Alteromonas sp. ASW11-36]MDM7859138.1 type II secretion system protein [Alteromonas sp. ASW11-36]
MINFPKRPVSRPSLSSQSGFSLVELITVILLIGILSVVAIARFSDSTGFAEFTYQNRLISALRNMQQRAMQDSRSGFCYQINIVSGAVSPAFGPPSTNYTAGNQANTCASNIDANTDFLATTSTEIAEQGLTISITDNGNNNVTFIGFDGLGRPQSNISNCFAGCRVNFVGETRASVCIESQGYVHAC